MHLMDGAMATELARRGLDLAQPSAVWNLTHPDDVRAVHLDYGQAGASVLLTNTFSANPTALAKHGFDDRLIDICEAGLRLAREVGGRDKTVLGCVGPMFDWDAGDPARYRDIPDRAMLVRVVSCLVDADAILLETCSSAETLADIRYLQHRVPILEKPIYLSVTYRDDKDTGLTTFCGHPPETFARHAEVHGVSALGVNCGRDVSLSRTLEVLRRYRECTDLPLFVRPNAGTPTKGDSGWVYPYSTNDFAEFARETNALGVDMIGGCCGTTPGHIEAIRDAVQSIDSSGSSSQP